MSAEAVAARLKPGWYKDVDFDTYVRWDAVNSHLLKGFSRTPAHVRYEMLHGGMDPTDSTERGWLLHLAVLEPERFRAEVTVAPKVDRRTKAGKQEWAEFTAAHDGHFVVEDDEYRTTCLMRDSLLAHPTARLLLTGRGVNELSIVWEEREAGVLCKARLDRVTELNEYPVIVDVKTARDASRRAFESQIVKLSYHIQASHYVRGLEAIRPVPAGNPYRRFLFAVVESAPPHLTAVYELAEEALAQAEQDRQRYLRTWRACAESGRFPGYPDGVDLVGLPAWAYRNFEGINE